MVYLSDIVFPLPGRKKKDRPVYLTAYMEVYVHVKRECWEVILSSITLNVEQALKLRMRHTLTHTYTYTPKIC